MGLMNRDRYVDEDRVVTNDEVVDRPADRNRYARSVVRALFTLAGVAVAGLLIWIASNFDLGQTSEFWSVMGLLAGAGLALGLSQLLGGWTKWGVPRVSTAVLLFAWLPTLIAAAWVLLATQPTGGWQQSRFESWSDSIGILGFVGDLGLFAAAIALAFGVVTAFIFDTTGPRERSRRPDTDGRRRRRARLPARGRCNDGRPDRPPDDDNRRGPRARDHGCARRLGRDDRDARRQRDSARHSVGRALQRE